MFVIDCNLARSLGMTYCIQKLKKKHPEFDYSGTLKRKVESKNYERGKEVVKRIVKESGPGLQRR